MNCYIYILESQKSGSFYVGITSNPIKRLCQHNSGEVTSTKSKGPWKIKYLKICNSSTEAKKLEYKLKSMKSHKFLLDIISGTKNLN